MKPVLRPSAASTELVSLAKANSWSTGSRPSFGSTIIIPYMPLAMWCRAGEVPQWYIQTPANSAFHS